MHAIAFACLMKCSCIILYRQHIGTRKHKGLMAEENGRTDRTGGGARPRG